MGKMTDKKEKAEKKIIDLASIDTVAGANKGFDVSIYHPGTLEDLGITITVLGKDSDLYRQKSTKMQQKRLDKLAKGGFRKKNMNIDGSDADAIRLLAECTTGWIGVIENKEEIPFSVDNAIDLYTKYPWMREQIDEAIADRSNFL